MLKYFIYELCVHPAKYEEAMSNSQNQRTIMCFTLKKRSHSASSAYNVQKGIRCNYIRNMKALLNEKKNTLTLS